MGIKPVDWAQLRERYLDEKFELELGQYYMLMKNQYELQQEIEKLQTEVALLRHTFAPANKIP